MIAALTFAGTAVFWNISNTAEVYALHAFFMLLNLYLLLLWKETQHRKWLYIFSFCFGLSLTNHLTSVLFIPAFLYLILFKRRYAINKRRIKIKLVFFCMFIFLIGLLPYLYLPLRSAMDPVIDWGNTQEPQNLLDHVTGKRYSGQFDVDLLSNIKTFFLLLIFNSSLILPFVIIGIFISRNNYNLLLLGLISVPVIIFNLTYGISLLG